MTTLPERERERERERESNLKTFANFFKVLKFFLKRGAATGGFLTACAHEFLFRGYAVKFFSIRLNIQHPYRWGQETRA